MNAWRIRNKVTGEYLAGLSCDWNTQHHQVVMTTDEKKAERWTRKAGPTKYVLDYAEVFINLGADFEIVEYLVIDQESSTVGVVDTVKRATSARYKKEISNLKREIARYENSRDRILQSANPHNKQMAANYQRRIDEVNVQLVDKLAQGMPKFT